MAVTTKDKVFNALQLNLKEKLKIVLVSRRELDLKENNRRW